MSLILATFTISCESDDERLELSEKSTDVFANVCKATFSSLSDLDIGQGQNGSSPRKIAPEKVDGTQTVYVKLTLDLDQLEIYNPLLVKRSRIWWIM